MGQKNQITTSDHLPYDEFTRLLDCLHKDEEYRWEMYARLSFCTACRASDTLNFRWKDILGVSSITIIEQKTKKHVKFHSTLLCKKVSMNYGIFWNARIRMITLWLPLKATSQ